jgi:hypothetical protein
MSTHEANIERAGNLIADAAEGLLRGFDAQLALTEIAGWTDLCPADVAVADWAACQEQYRNLYRQLAEILANN